MMDFPKLVALDTDGTIWEGGPDDECWGKGHGALDPIEDNIERVDYSLLRDKTDHQKSINVYSEISDVISDILKNGASLAIVSSNTSRALHGNALSYVVATDPKDGNKRPIVQLAKYNHVSNGRALQKIKEWSGIEYSDMILFDDEAMNNAVRIRLGVTFHAIRHGKGFTWGIYREVTSHSHGQNRPMIDLLRGGECRVHRDWTCRWGFGLYATDHPGIAKFYSDWEKREGREGWVCAIWVRDYDTWMNRVNEIWIPEIDVGLPQMDNRTASEEETGWNQENRDRAIADRWGVHTPYVLFSRHRFLDGMPIALKERSNELLLPTQVPQSLCYLTEISDAEAEQTPIPFHYHLQTKAWNITVPEDTKQDFLKHGETLIL